MSDASALPGHDTRVAGPERPAPQAQERGS
jgi:hypothetical protein